MRLKKEREGAKKKNEDGDENLVKDSKLVSLFFSLVSPFIYHGRH